MEGFGRWMLEDEGEDVGRCCTARMRRCKMLVDVGCGSWAIKLYKIV